MTRTEENNLRQLSDLRPAKELAALIKTKKSTIKYPVYITKTLNETDLEVLDLSVRANNGLRRAGYMSVGELMDSIDGIADLKRIRGMGEKTAQEIMYKLYLYQYEVLKPERQTKFLFDVAKMNGIMD